jgi:EmrB/QacA subfamily drug resistance transporter
MVLVAVVLGTFTVNLTVTILTIAIGPIAEDLGSTISIAAWLTVGPMVVAALLTPAAGRAADRHGRKRLFMGGFFVATLGILLSGLAPTMPTLIAARLLSGVGTAAVMPSGLALVTSAYPDHERSIPLGWWTSVAALAPTVGIIVGGFVVESIGWRWLFFAQLPFAFAALLMAGLVLDESRTESRARFDVQGATLIAVSVFSLLVAVNRGADWGFGSAPTLGLITLGTVSLVLAVRVELRVPEPVIPPHLFQRRDTGAALFNRAMLSGVYMGAFIILPLWMMEVRGMGPAMVALALVPRPLAMSLTGPFTARLGLRWSERALVQVGSVAICGSCGFMALMNPDIPYPLLAVALVVMGGGLAFTQTATAQVVTRGVTREELGTASGVLAITSTLSYSIGMAGLLAVVEVAGGTASPFAHRVAFGLACALSLVTIPVNRRIPVGR